MATTPTYGWETPDDTDLVKDGAAAIRTLGNAIDTTMGTMVAKTLVDAKGDIIAATAADTVSRLAVGANNTILTADSSTATGLKWATPAGGGKVLQVVSATTTTSTTIASLTLTDTTLTATITPTLATSKIMVFITQNVYISRSSSEQGAGMVLLRDATSIFDMNQGGIGASFFSGTGVTALETRHMVSVSYLDSPATTSATTYKTQGRIELTTNAGGSVYQNGSRPSTITLMEIGA